MRDDLRKLWDFMREVTGDDAYERYLERHRRTHPDVTPLTEKEFFASEQERKWDGINRCC
jgi:uncharacterized short protein YbdD (DUF466 family)